jgi:transposase
MEQRELFANDSTANQHQGAERAAAPLGAPRMISADRGQIAWRPFDLESLIPPDHRARLMWGLIDSLDLSLFYEPIKAREGKAGRTPTDPKVQLALWLFATADGVNSAREIDRLSTEHRAYQWLRGGVPVNHHMLSDFRGRHGEAFDELLTQMLAVLLHQRSISLKRVSQDGLRVRASAGTGSFRRCETLEKCLKAARRHVRELKAEAEDAQLNAQRAAARQRAAREAQQRVERALDEVKKLQGVRGKASGGRKAKGEPRASTTDADARKMRMADGGFRPAYNVQMATDTEDNLILGVSVTNKGSDQGQAQEMIKQVERRTGKRLSEYLVDGGYTGKQNIEECDGMGITVYGPVVERRGSDPQVPQPGESAAVIAWRKRMGSKKGKQIYKERAQYSERVNADVRVRRTLDRLLVRGLTKVTNVALINALAYNLLRWISFGGNT